MPKKYAGKFTCECGEVVTNNGWAKDAHSRSKTHRRRMNTILEPLFVGLEMRPTRRTLAGLFAIPMPAYEPLGYALDGEPPNVMKNGSFPYVERSHV